MRVTVFIVELADLIYRQQGEHVGQIAEIQVKLHMYMQWLLHQLTMSEL